MERFQFLDISQLDGSALAGLQVAVLGYGNQGRTHALNLRDSGLDVIVGQREGKGYELAIEDGFTPQPLEQATAAADVLMLALPDVALGEIFTRSIKDFLRPEQTLLLAHGFAAVYGLIKPPEGVDLALVAPKGAGAGIRALYQQGQGVPALLAVHQDATGQAMARAAGYGWGIGCARSGLIAQTTFADETHTDLFGEQAVLCGGIPTLMQAAFETMVSRGYPPEMAYFECIHEAKLVVDLIYARGLAGMRSAISDTAAWGGLTAGPDLIDSDTRQRMEQTLTAIESGAFAKEWMDEVAQGRPRDRDLRNQEQEHPSQAVGAGLRRAMGLQD